jgi:hypothetical protein
LGEFSETPLAVEPVLGEHQQHGLRAGQLPVKRTLPICAGWYPAVLVKVEERSANPWPCNQACRLSACSLSRFEWLMKTHAIFLVPRR